MEADVAARSRGPSWGAVLGVAALLFSVPGLAAPAAPPQQRGFVSDGVAGGLVFQRCDAALPAAQALMLQDKTAGRALGIGIGAVREVMLDPARPLYVEFRGDALGTLMTARQFQRAIGHVPSCAAAPPALPEQVRLWAVGGMPAWRLQATPAGARLEVVGARPERFSAVAPHTADAGKPSRKFSAKSIDGGAPMALELVEQPCNDLQAETAYGARVAARLGERRLEGCAARF